MARTAAARLPRVLAGRLGMDFEVFGVSLP